MLTELPVIVIDLLLSKYVSDNDLRAIHQVSKGWKNLIESRILVNARRIALVNTIREHKENIRKSTQPLVLPSSVTDSKATDERNPKENHDEKTGSGRTLRNLTNSVLVTPAMSDEATDSEPTTNGRRVTRISSTPKSRFQRRFEAGLKLMPGQVLFSCPGCNSPVPSPLPSLVREKKHSSEVTCSDTFDSGIGFSITSSLEEDLSQLIRQAESSVFKMSSPELRSPSINISVIVTPPFTPPSLETGIEEESSLYGTPYTEYGLLRCLHNKQLKLKSCSSPSLLVSEVKTEIAVRSILTNTPPYSPAVVECPDCSFRFCSQCQFSEHNGKPCRLLGGDDMYEEEDSISLPPLPPARPQSKPRARSANSTSGKSNKKKGSLRRLAYI